MNEETFAKQKLTLNYSMKKWNQGVHAAKLRAVLCGILFFLFYFTANACVLNMEYYPPSPYLMVLLGISFLRK